MQSKNDAIKNNLENMKVVLSHNIKYYRKYRKISQQTLADLCDLHRTYISDLENGKCNPTLSVLLSLATYLDVSICDLLEKRV